MVKRSDPFSSIDRSVAPESLQHTGQPAPLTRELIEDACARILARDPDHQHHVKRKLLDQRVRDLVMRLVGWDNHVGIAAALRAIRLAQTERMPLILSGDGDQTAIARAIHDRVLDDVRPRPFVVCDPRRHQRGEDVRSPENVATWTDAVRQADGGSLCVWSRRLPRDFGGIRSAAACALVIVCTESGMTSKPYHIEPLTVPRLKDRQQDIPRIILECTADAVWKLDPASVGLALVDRYWISRHSASTVTEIAKGTRRLVALRSSANTTEAARMLGMSQISLHRWLRRRGPLP